MRVWTYAIATDAGGAPNFEPPCATLAICKPPIRRKAEIGDLVLAFNGRDAERAAGARWEPNSVRWAGIVSEALPFARYWSDPRFAGKRTGWARMPDNIYELVDGVLTQVVNQVHDDGHVANDLRGENALVFTRAWYFGDSAPVLPEAFGLWMPVRARIGQRLTILADGTAQRVIAWLDDQPRAAPHFGPARGGCAPAKPSPRPAAASC